MKMKKTLAALLLVMFLSVTSASALAEWGDLFGGMSSLFSADEEEAYAVGELATLDDIEVKLINVMQSNGNSYYKPETGNKFVILEFEVKNTGREELVLSTVMSFDAWCDDEHYEISLDALAVSMLNGKYQLDTVVEPGKTVYGVVGYEMPSEWQEIKIEFIEEIFFGERAVFLIEREEK